MHTAQQYLDILRSAREWVYVTETKISDALVQMLWRYGTDMGVVFKRIGAHAARIFLSTKKPCRRMLSIGPVDTLHSAPEDGLTLLHMVQKNAGTLPTNASNHFPIVMAIIFVLASFLLWSFITYNFTKIDTTLQLSNKFAPTPEQCSYTTRSARIIQNIEDRWPTYNGLSSSQTQRYRWHNSPLVPQPLDLATAALTASSLLSTFAASVATSSGRFRAHQKQNLNAALAELLAIRARVKAFGGEHGMRVRSNEMMVEAGCVICHAEITDTLFIPCRHMVVCGACSEQLGVGDDDSSAVGTPKCPVCEMAVDRSIKVFRE